MAMGHWTRKSRKDEALRERNEKSRRKQRQRQRHSRVESSSWSVWPTTPLIPISMADLLLLRLFSRQPTLAQSVCLSFFIPGLILSSLDPLPLYVFPVPGQKSTSI